jgi:hypothetical protein
VLEDAVVDFVFVVMINVVEKVNMLLFISNVGMFFLDFFSFLTYVPHPILLPVLSPSKNETSNEKFVDNGRTTKIIPYTLLRMFACPSLYSD